jgi:hypothetical protein
VSGAPTSPARTLSLLEKGSLALEVASAYVRVRRLLRGASVPEVLEGLRSVPARRHAVSPPPVQLGAVVRRVLCVLPGDTRCLTQSLVLTALLARRGIDSSLVIAVSSSGSFSAHAWVEQEGRALLPRGGGFAPIVQL